MPLAVTCSACAKTFRVKDELAGKRVACPKCSKPVRIPAAEEPPEEEVLDDMDEEQEEEQPEEDKPRKKKKKKKAGGTGMPGVALPALPDLGLSYRMLLFLALAVAGFGLLIFFSVKLLPDWLNNPAGDPKERARSYVRTELLPKDEPFREVAWHGPYESKPSAKQRFQSTDDAGHAVTVDTEDGGVFAIRLQFETDRPYKLHDQRLGDFLVNERNADIIFLISKKHGDMVVLPNHGTFKWEKLITDADWTLMPEKSK